MMRHVRFGSACESSQGVEISGEEDLVLGTESSIVSIKTNDSKESTIITRETNLTTEITGQKFSKVTSTRVSIAKRCVVYRTPDVALRILPVVWLFSAQGPHFVLS